MRSAVPLILASDLTISVCCLHTPQEDKIAGMNVLRHCLTRGGLAPQWASELRALEELYASGHVFAWWVGCRLPARPPSCLRLARSRADSTLHMRALSLCTTIRSQTHAYLGLPLLPPLPPQVDLRRHLWAGAGAAHQAAATVGAGRGAGLQPGGDGVVQA